MMNPGSSGPVDLDYQPKTYHTDTLHRLISYKEFVPARPDNSQYQIMRLMLDQDWKHVRIINLSDLRSGDSSVFEDKFMLAADSDASYPHSIFSSARRQELFELAQTDGAIIVLAWGRISFLGGPATEALRFFQSRPMCVGVKVKGESLSYYHANQRTPARLRGWLREIKHQLESKKVRA